MKKFAILVDTVSSVGSNGNPEIEDTYVLPLGLTTPSGENVPDATSHITVEQILESASKKQYYKTSTTKPKLFFDKVDELLKDYERVIYLAISSQLSSQFMHLSQLVATEEKYKDKVWVVDTLSAGVAIEKMVYDIKELIDNGYKIDYRILQKIVAQENNGCLQYIICKNLLGVQEGGRIDHLIIKGLAMLSRVPIILFDQKNTLKATESSYDKAVRKIIVWAHKRAKKQNSAVTACTVVYSDENTKKLVQAYAQVISSTFNIPLNQIEYRHIMYPVLVHTLFDTMCFYFGFNK